MVGLHFSYKDLGFGYFKFTIVNLMWCIFRLGFVPVLLSRRRF